MKSEEGQANYVLDVPLDTSALEGLSLEEELKVVIRDHRGALRSETVTLSGKRPAAAQFAFRERPGSLKVMVGPATASDEEMTRLQTLAVDIPARRWAKPELRLPAIKISPWYWQWWRTWCREFVVHGIVQCPDGKPVPGAKVCAYDVDWWWWWGSSQLVSCTATDVNGLFEMRFKWCCGWWPWWWWQNRHWSFEPLLAERIAPVLQLDPTLPRIAAQSPRPDLEVFEGLLAGGGLRRAALPSGSGDIDPARLAGLRERLLERLPRAPELERLRVWPWWPWAPWRDCAPDLIFKVTQTCDGAVRTIVNETFWDARWNVPTTLNVALQANDQACCAPSYDCPAGECTLITRACNELRETIGGNIGADASPVGYASPGVGDNPFGGRVTIAGTTECMAGVDYYEFEWTTTPAIPASWVPVPAATCGSFVREYVDFAFPFPPPTLPAVFQADVPIDGRNVYETIQHYEATHDPATWNVTRVWTNHFDTLMEWLTENTIGDGTYYLRVKGWDIDGAGHLINPRVLKVCESAVDNYLVLRIDNRPTPGIGPTDSHGNPCGAGTVHTCTVEPDTAIVALWIERGTDHSFQQINACGKVDVSAGDSLVVDFVAHDPDGHLGSYSLEVHYDVNASQSLLTLGGTLEGHAPPALPPGFPPAASQVGPTYAQARLEPGPPAFVEPVWHGGTMRLKVPATGPEGFCAFPITCCYQLRLDASKRTIYSCTGSHSNRSEYSFTVNVT